MTLRPDGEETPLMLRAAARAIARDRDPHAYHAPGSEVPRSLLSYKLTVGILPKKITEDKLINLNHRVVERLRFFQQMHAHVGMLEFKIGDRVRFRPDHRGWIEGMVTRYNRKTVTIVTDDGHS